VSDDVPSPPRKRQNFLGGFKLTLEHLGRPPVTRQYPEEKRPKQPRQHGRHVLNRYEDGMEKCIGCELCAGVCPADCIYVRGLDNPPDHPVSPGERYGYVYEINFLRCIHCDMCVEACPTEAITESKLMEFSFTNRHDAIYTKAELVVDDDGRPRRQPWEDWRDEDELHTSASARRKGARAADATTGPPGRNSCGTRWSAICVRPTCPPPSAVPGVPSGACWRRPSGSPPAPPSASSGTRRRRWPRPGWPPTPPDR
jgi:NADH-quinone oxidoreductase subunit I